MILVVGLGNIGDTYKDTRHNVGFMLVDLILKNYNFLQITNAKFKGELYKINSSLFLKPNTYMNHSGLSVKAVKDFYKCQRIIVIHDDIDLKFGALKFKKAGSSGGHNGLKSIDEYCSNDYERVRIGIGRSNNIKEFVLSKFNEDEKIILDKVLDRAKDALFELINSNDITHIASKYSLKVL
ncbi:aminoacyl-tRNA hydrolase [Campylobacter novaezeelandiae]|uniref:aminoacyl-tRNA hydrolase n=1 Tax=Campylobacter novaezeelandiae TaxID=2267891 RepID=UPI001037C3D7|nr:aminoacyl-tRNA hydrolase [Campylobacter novaezeelandiae]QWU80659.1 peptidyl-tRNA hydrolase [Campylobacter novaezeelandiae]TBR79710.1 aminoacyl-tRNA hydrolase [Campylobacter novaezeelandiae]TBR80316.1 aminoacyl-tRNA hydrolase [Campylobacter novaezeelandiae]